jgi:threonine/homoserine/homoserine lactone efflux protein
MVHKFDHISRAFDQLRGAYSGHVLEEVEFFDRWPGVAGQGGRMTAVLEIASLVTVAAVTPGPNNLIVLRAATRAGLTGALPAIAGVVVGGLAMLALALLAADTVLAALPHAQLALGVAGCCYLGWLGFGLLRHAGRVATSGDRRLLAEQPAPSGDHRLPAASLPGVFAFQFLNPKAWVLVMTAVGAAPAGDLAWWPLLAIFATIPTMCLALWACLGAILARWLARPRVAVNVDRAMGLVLLATAASLLYGLR